MLQVEQQYSFLRTLFWPINRSEVKKLVPMFIMLFLLSFNQGALWNMKDSLMITTSGAEIIPFIKVWAILPSAILFTSIFAFLSNRYSQEKVFYLLTSSFLFFYALFAFVLYPYRDQLHPLESATYLESLLPAGFKGLISLYRYWTFTGFYVVCELWNTIVISVLFWGFVNQITSLVESRRFYSVLSIACNVAIIVAGVASIVIASRMTGKDAWEQSMTSMILIVIASGLLTMLVFRWMHQNVLKNGFNDAYKKTSPVKEKKKFSLRESISYVSQSRYLMCIAVMVVGSSLVINMVEIIWKDQLKNLYPGTLDYTHYISNLQIIQGVVAIIMSFGIAEMVKRQGWTKAALVTPIVMTLLCVFFFGLIFFQNHLKTFFLSFLGMSPLPLIVMVGSIQNVLSKACKYSIFDSTKEMAFTPLSMESKLKGKTAIDGVGIRLGKSGGSFIHQGFLIIFTSVGASAPYVGVFLIAALVVWMIAVRVLGIEMGKGVSNQPLLNQLT